MSPEELPSPGSRCVVEGCEQPASTFIDVTGGGTIDGEETVIMCDQHAAHWRSGGA